MEEALCFCAVSDSNRITTEKEHYRLCYNGIGCNGINVMKLFALFKSNNTMLQEHSLFCSCFKTVNIAHFAVESESQTSGPSHES